MTDEQAALLSRQNALFDALRALHAEEQTERFDQMLDNPFQDKLPIRPEQILFCQQKSRPDDKILFPQELTDNPGFTVHLLGEKVGEYLWNKDRNQLIRILFNVGTTGRNGLEIGRQSFDTYEQAVESICDLPGDLLGDTTCIIHKMFTTTGVPSL